MRLYPSLFAYLNNCQPVPQDTLLHASDRPIIALDSEEDFSDPPFFIPIGDRVYEIAFPYLKPTDNFLEHRDGYLYSSAYHYWNHYSEISQHKLIKPLVFINLDSFGCVDAKRLVVRHRLIPVTFSRSENTPYQVPILNTNMEYLLSKSPSQFQSQYKQNAFLSLLYLLTFRANDKVFCQPDSDEMLMAKQVINYFKDDKIILNQVSKEKPLNQFFQEMIEGTATEDDVEILLSC